MNNRKNKRVLVLAAHPDDEILGAYSYLCNKNYKAQTVFVCEGSTGRFGYKNSSDQAKSEIKLREKSAQLVASALGNESPIFLNFPNFSLSTLSVLEINNMVEPLIRDFTPDILITHSPLCNNLDHASVSIAVSNLVRSNAYPSINSILHMEIPSSSEQSISKQFSPNHFMNLTENQLEHKIEMLGLYGRELQNDPAPRSNHGIRAYAAFRGLFAGTYYAEAFTIIRNTSTEWI